MKVKHLLHCHLLLPIDRLRVAAADKPLPALKKLLGWSLPPVMAPEGGEAWLCRRFGATRQADWPTASLAALGAGLNAQTGYWLHADPAYAHLLRDRIILTDEAFADLTPDAAGELIDTLNRHFADEGLAFFAPCPNRWYLRLKDAATINTCPRADAVNADIRQHLPSGPESMSWHRRLNEVQMLLHDHPVNQRREPHGYLPVNSLWLWGGGVLPYGLSSPFAGLWSNDALAMGLAIAGGCPSSARPASAGAWLAQTPAAGDHLVIPDAAVDLERDWFAPMAAALKNGQLDSLTLHLSAPQQVQSFAVPRSQCWKFWRRAQPLEFMIHD